MCCCLVADEHVREIVSFDMDLMDCTVLACVLSAYCPFLVSQLTYILYHLYTVQYPVMFLVWYTSVDFDVYVLHTYACAYVLCAVGYFCCVLQKVAHTLTLISPGLLSFHCSLLSSEQSRAVLSQRSGTDGRTHKHWHHLRLPSA